MRNNRGKECCLDGSQNQSMVIFRKLLKTSTSFGRSDSRVCPDAHSPKNKHKFLYKLAIVPGFLNKKMKFFLLFLNFGFSEIGRKISDLENVRAANTLRQGSKLADLVLTVNIN